MGLVAGLLAGLAVELGFVGDGLGLEVAGLVAELFFCVDGLVIAGLVAGGSTTFSGLGSGMARNTSSNAKSGSAPFLTAVS